MPLTSSLAQAPVCLEFHSTANLSHHVVPHDHHLSSHAATSAHPFVVHNEYARVSIAGGQCLSGAQRAVLKKKRKLVQCTTADMTVDSQLLTVRNGSKRSRATHGHGTMYHVRANVCVILH